MRWLISIGLGAVLLIAAGTAAGLLRDDADNEGIAALVEQLGDRTFAKREQASKELEALGERALPILRRAATSSGDLETRQRARGLIRAILAQASKSKSTGLEMIVIDEGEFRMGSQQEANRRDDETQHKVRITTAFLLGKFEVTQDEYRQVMKSSPSWCAPTGGGKAKVLGMDTSRFPVDSVSWFDAVEFCNRLSKQDGFAPYYKLTNVQAEADVIKNATVAVGGGNGYRLPTEAEWEYACRARSTTPFHFGVQNTGREANVQSGAGGGYGGPPTWQSVGRSAKVGSYPANAWGLHDMHGNVAEWCFDWYGKDYYAAAPVDDPQGPPKGDHRILRGGSWLVTEGSCRAASRHWRGPGEINYYGGFRVARTPQP